MIEHILYHHDSCNQFFINWISFMIEICVTGIKIDGEKHQLTSAIMMSMLLHAENLCQKESNNVLNNLT